ncbi:hypothetical protein Gpo141_00009256 [Globisporangium polare]
MAPMRRYVLLVVDVACTVLTLMTGLQENPLLVALTGRYNSIRSRFDQGNVNYDSVRANGVDMSTLPKLNDVSSSYRIITAPERSPSNLGEDRSTCLRVNSMSASVLAIQFDDMFGKGARREQLFLYSISAPHCSVINFESEWLEQQCIATKFHGDTTACYQFIFDNFDALLANKQLQVGVQQDFGAPGRPFLKCQGRAYDSFEYMTDLLVLQSYWAGGSYHIEMQSSQCRAVPVIRDTQWQYGLFTVEATTPSASVVCAIRETSWVALAVSWVFGVTSLVMIARGIVMSLLHDSFVKYVPSGARVQLPLPFIALSTRVFPPAKRTDVVSAEGERYFASDLWMNHWLYITLSIADAVLRVRTTYVVLEMGAWMLNKQRNVENFLFVCTALTRLTWIACFVHTVARYSLKILVLTLKSLHRATRMPYEAIDWYIDATALFISYKAYAILISGFLYGMLQVRGTTSFMTRQTPSTTAVFGGFADIANFWRSEIVGDLGLTCAVVLLAAQFLATLLLCTKYRTLTHNRLLQMLQSRYIFVGWDIFVAIEALAIDPSDPTLVQNGVAMTKCSFASLLQQLYASGPSGFVAFAGDAVFLSARESSEPTASCPSILRYLPHDAQSMGLWSPEKEHRQEKSPQLEREEPVDDSLGSRERPPLHRATTTPQLLASAASIIPRSSSVYLRRTAASIRSSPPAALVIKCGNNLSSSPPLPLSFDDRKLRIHSESRWGKLVLVDVERAPGELECAQDGATHHEFVVQDALSMLHPREFGAFLSRERLLLRIS